MFNSNDYYVASGSTEIQNAWTATVTKHDTSSFYNWEQDNLPIYDLEERTHQLWEKSGFPTSSIPGVSLVVSSVGPYTGNIYPDVSSAIASLPDVIRFPVVIEVAASGDLGELNLNGLKFDGPTAGLEIVNRAFGKALSLSSTVIGDQAVIQAITDGSAITEVSALDLSATLSATSAVSVSALVTNDWTTCSVAIFAHPEWGTNGKRTNNVVVSINNSGLLTASANTFDLTEDFGADTSVPIIPTHGADDSLLDRGQISTGNLTGYIYGNTLTGITIKDCPGNVYIRGFVVDGGELHTKETGISINNSEVLLENCAVIRCKQNGAEIDNSVVTLARGFTAYRNYTLSSTPSARVNTLAAGMLVTNSKIILSSTTDQTKSLPIDSPFIFAYNEDGLRLNNSTITGGAIRGYDEDGAEVTGVAERNKNILYVSAFKNTYEGIRLTMADWKTNARVNSFYNGTGLEAIHSEVKIPELSIGYNTLVGIKLIESNLTYNSNLVTESTGFGTSLGKLALFELNGQHIKAIESTISIIEETDMPSKFSQIYFDRSHGTRLQGSSVYSLPSIELKDCTTQLVCPRIVLEDYLTNNSLFVGTVHKGSAVKAIGGSLDLIGTGAGATVILGPVNIANQTHNAGIYVDDCNLKISGPTTIGQFGIDILGVASKVDIAPQETPIWDLSTSSNHTKVQLHSTRACIVADKGTLLSFENLGDYHATWTDADIVSSLIVDGSSIIADFNAEDELNLSGSVSAGYMQFFPNPQDLDGTFINTLGYNNISAGVYLTSEGYDELVDYTDASAADINRIFSYGGVCVRALRGSHVEVKNVHFPTGWHNASGAVYDISGDNCDTLYIWNIADNSTFHACYTSVSGTFPSLAGYHGPSAVYTESGVELSGAPSSTPGTSSLSVLDSFGKGASLGKSTWENQGPFRIYVSPTGPAKFLGYVSGTEIIEGRPYQQVAQGYNPSGNVAVYSASAASALYEELATSGFIYASALTEPSFNRIRLDESAANTFANAKHAAQGKYGTNKLVTIYKAIRQPTGEGYDADKVAGHGQGFLSANIFDLDRNN
jgi:hypothetical protein